MEPIHIMKPGAHVSSEGASVSFSNDDIATCARVYDTRRHEAPIVAGHPKTDAPAYGWIDRLEVRGDGLYAVPRQVNAEFADAVRQGSYKKVSGCFYRPESANSPSPGNWYLRHVGFLGAAAPAVKGLRAVAFADAGDVTATFEEAGNDLRDYRLGLRERELLRRENESFLDVIRKKGTIPVGLLDEVSSFMETLSEEATFSFSEAGSEEAITGSQIRWFKKFVSLLPVPVMLGELATSQAFAEGDAEFSAPKNYTVDPESAKIHRMAVAYQQKTGAAYADAVKTVIAHGRSE